MNEQLLFLGLCLCAGVVLAGFAFWWVRVRAGKRRIAGQPCSEQPCSEQPGMEVLIVFTGPSAQKLMLLPGGEPYEDILVPPGLSDKQTREYIRDELVSWSLKDIHGDIPIRPVLVSPGMRVWAAIRGMDRQRAGVPLAELTTDMRVRVAALTESLRVRGMKIKLIEEEI